MEAQAKIFFEQHTDLIFQNVTKEFKKSDKYSKYVCCFSNELSVKIYRKNIRNVVIMKEYCNIACV